MDGRAIIEIDCRLCRTKNVAIDAGRRFDGRFGLIPVTQQEQRFHLGGF
jgi:hypothetical protein